VQTRLHLPVLLGAYALTPPVSRVVHSVDRRAAMLCSGCGKPARPDLWEPRVGNSPVPPDPQHRKAVQAIDLETTIPLREGDRMDEGMAVERLLQLEEGNQFRDFSMPRSSGGRGLLADAR